MRSVFRSSKPLIGHGMNTICLFLFGKTSLCRLFLRAEHDLRLCLRAISQRITRAGRQLSAPVFHNAFLLYLLKAHLYESLGEYISVSFVPPPRQMYFSFWSAIIFMHCATEPEWLENKSNDFTLIWTSQTYYGS